MDRLDRSGQITIIPKPELRGFWGDSLSKPPFLRFSDKLRGDGISGQPHIPSENEKG